LRDHHSERHLALSLKFCNIKSGYKSFTVNYNITFVNSERWLAKSRVDITPCQHGKFLSLYFFVLYYKTNIKHFFRIDIQLYQHKWKLGKWEIKMENVLYILLNGNPKSNFSILWISGSANFRPWLDYFTCIKEFYIFTAYQVMHKTQQKQ
jgi:hypothetical protein